MTVSYKDRILATTTSTGTGTLTQVATFTGYRAPVAADDGKTFVILITAVDLSGNPTGDWEICESVYSHSGTTWSRGTLYSSSTGSRVSFAAGTTKRIAVVNSANDIAKIGNYVDVATYATGGIGTSVSPWTGWDTAITWAANTEYRFRSGYFSYVDSPNFLLAGISLIGEAGAILKHTGTGNAFVMDAGVTWIAAARVENLIIQGNANTTNAMYLNGVRFCQFANIRIRGCSAAGLRSERCVTNSFVNFTCSYIESGGSFVVTPVNGVLLTNGTTTWSFINPTIEGVSGDGITIPTTVGAASFANVFNGGTCEVCGGFGVKTSIANSLNVFLGMDFESNGGVRSSAYGDGTNNGDISDSGINYWYSCDSSGFAEFNSYGGATNCSFRDFKDTVTTTFINCLYSGTSVYSFSSRRINVLNSGTRKPDPDVAGPSGLNWNQFSPSASGTHTPDAQAYPGQRIILPAGNITVASPTGGSVMFQKLLLQVVQDSGGSRTITWGSGFAGTVPQPTVTASSITMYEFAYNIFTTKWDLLYSH